MKLKTRYVAHYNKYEVFLYYTAEFKGWWFWHTYSYITGGSSECWKEEYRFKDKKEVEKFLDDRHKKVLEFENQKVSYKLYNGYPQ